VKVHARTVALRRAFECEIEARFNEITATQTTDERAAAMDDMIGLLKRIAASDLRLWSFREQLCRTLFTPESREDLEATSAMIAQLVNHQLAACTPG
jgi:hypothetical protein